MLLVYLYVFFYTQLEIYLYDLLIYSCYCYLMFVQEKLSALLQTRDESKKSKIRHISKIRHMSKYL